MPDTNNNDVLGSTASVNAGSAIENVQAEEIKRLESEKQQAQAANPTPQSIPNPPLITAEDVLSLLPPAVPLSAAEMMQEAAQEAQARTSAAEARAAQFAAPSAAPVSRPSAFDATAANARAASRPMTASPTRSSGLTLSAPPDAGNAFDWEAYEQARHTGYWTEPTPQPLSAAVGEASPLEGAPASDPRVAPSPLYTTSGLSDIETRYPYSNNFASRVLEYQQEIEAQRTARAASIAAAVSPSEDAPGSFRDRARSYFQAGGPMAGVGSVYEALRSAVSPTAEPEEAPKRTYASYEEAQQAKADILADARNAYAQSGRVSEIGKAGFNAEVKAVEISQGLQEPKGRGLSGALANMREDFAEPYGKLNYGYGLAQLGQETGQYYQKTDAGNYLTPEERETAAAGLLPGIGAIAGTAIGSMIAPGVGSWVGGMIGAGAGQAVSGVVGANEERAQASRQIGDEFVAALGEATSKLKDFSAEAQATGAPLKELQQVLSTAGSVAPLGANAIAGAGAMTNALGEYAPENYASVARQLKDPLVFSLASEMGQNGRLTQAGYQALGYKAAIEGDAEGLQQDDLAAQRATLADNPQYQAAQQQLRNAENPLGIAADVLPLLQGNSAPLAARLGVGVRAYHDSKDLEENNPGDPTAKARAAVFQQFGQIREDEGVNRALGGEAEAARAGIGLRGGSAADIAAGSVAVRASYAAQEGDISKAITALQAQLADPTVDHKALDPLLKAQIAGQQTDLRDLQNKDAEMARSDYLAPVAERGAAFSLSVAQSVYSGQSVSARAGIVRSQEDFLSGMADNPGPLSPGERDQLRAGVLKQQYDFQEEEFSENAASYGLTEAGNRDRLSRGLYGGQSFGQMQGDEDRNLAADRARAAQLRTEADSAGVPYTERIQKLAQADSLETGALEQQHGFLQNVYRQAVVQDDLTVGRAGLGVEQARAFGTEASVYGAQGQEADALRAKMAELTRQLAAGGNTADETAEKMRQITQAGGQLNSVLAQQRDERLAAQQSVASSQFQQDTAGLGRQVQIGGSGAVDFAAINADFQKRFAADQADINAYKPGDPRRNAAEAKLATDRAESRDFEGGLTRYTPTAQTGIQGLAVEDAAERARHAFQREMLLPYRTGDPNSTPLTRGLDLERALDKSAAFVDMQAQAATAYRSAQQNKMGADGRPLWDPLAEENYQRQMLGFQEQKDNLLDQRVQVEHDRMWEEDRRLPEMIAGGGGLSGNSVLAVPQAALSALFHPNVRDGAWGHPVTQPGLSRPGSMPGNAYDGFQQHASGSPATTFSGAGSVQGTSLVSPLHYREVSDNGSIRELTEQQYRMSTVNSLMRGGGFGSMDDPDRVKGTGQARSRQEAEALYDRVQHDPYASREGQAAATNAGGTSVATALQTLAHGMNTHQLATIMQQVLQTLQRMEAANRTQMPSQGGPPLTGGSRTIQNNQQSFNPNRPSQR